MNYTFENNDMTQLMNSYLVRGNLVNYKAAVAVDENKNKMYIIVKDQYVVYEHTSAEAVAAYIDMLIVDKKFANKGL